MKIGRASMFLKTKQRGKPSYAAVPPVRTSSMTDHLVTTSIGLNRKNTETSLIRKNQLD